MKVERKIDFRTKQETITVFYTFSSRLFINLMFLPVCVCDCIQQEALLLKCKSDFTTEYNTG
jgi:hypothetical protein